MNATPEIENMPVIPKGAAFSYQKIKAVCMPHPYCITSRHVAIASARFGGMLNEATIREAEKQGAYCDICAKSGQDILSFEKHKNNLTLFILVPQNRDLNAVDGLGKFLFENKQKFIDAGIQGFAFPTA
jgi:hypothetical protein